MADATSINGYAEANADVPTGVVAFQPDLTQIDGSGLIAGKAKSTLTAKATTTGDDAATDYASAQAGAVTTKGLNLIADITT
ncbi:MAG: hypothetical protein ACKOPN_07480, partial [Prochlorococcaceae cyanobacterium]